MGCGTSRQSKIAVEPQQTTFKDEAMETYLNEFKIKQLEHPEKDFHGYEAKFIKGKFVIENSIKELRRKNLDAEKMESVLCKIRDVIMEADLENISREPILADQFALSGLVNVLCECATTLFTLWSAGSSDECWQVYVSILEIMFNASDKSSIVCLCLMECGFLEENLKILKNLSYMDVRIEDLEKNVGGVNRSYFRQLGIVETITPFKKSEETLLQLLANMILDVMNLDHPNEDSAEEDESDYYCVNILRRVDASIENVTVYYKFSQGILRLSVEEIAYTLPGTASNEKRHKKLLKDGILEVCDKLMNRDKEAERYYGVETVFQLSFNSECKEELKQNKDVMKSLLTLRSNGSERVKKAAEGALSNLQTEKGKDELLDDKTKSSTNKNGHIMISYPWRYQSLMIKIKKQLERTGYAVWFDVDKMGGSLTESMANAINNASIVLICIAEAYYQSPNCRREAEYALDHGKDIIPLRIENYKPANWLGLVVAQKLYVDFTQSVDKGMGDLMQRVSRQEESGGYKLKEKVSEDRIRPSMRYHPAQKWNEDGVEAWLEQNDIDFLSDDVTGSNLVCMMNLRIEAPEFFYDYADRKLGADDMEKLERLSKALDNLESLTSAIPS